MIFIQHHPKTKTSKSMHYVYVLKSLANASLYVGSTNNLRKRFQEHNLGKGVYTSQYRPWELMYYEAYITENLARLRETRLKQHGNAFRELKKRISPA